MSLYDTLADTLLRGGEGLFGLEGREHTAQVDQKRREWREWRFRWGRGGSGPTRRSQGNSAPGGRAERFSAGSVLLADDGAGRRYLGAERRLPAQRAADTGQLCAALGPRRTIGPGSARRDLLRGAEPARSVLLQAGPTRWSAASFGRQRSNWPTATLSKLIFTRSGLPNQGRSLPRHSARPRSPEDQSAGPIRRCRVTDPTRAWHEPQRRCGASSTASMPS